MVKQTRVSPMNRPNNQQARPPTMATMPAMLHQPASDEPVAPGYPSMPFNPGMHWPNPQASLPPMQRYREMTIDEMLLENRVIFLVGEINYASATGVIMRLLHLQNQKKDTDINLYINSHGGSVDDTLAIYDTIKFLGSDVSTYCIGRAESGAALVLAAGAKDKRYILPHARVMIHQPYGGVTGQTTDIQIQAEEILRAKQQLNEILSEVSGQPLEKVQEDSERDLYFTAKEAKEYGIVDKVLGLDDDDDDDAKKKKK